MLLRYTHIYVPVIILLWLGLFIDSQYFSTYLPNNQWLTNGLVLIMFAHIIRQVSNVARHLMLVGVLLAYGGELILALVLGMYSYRLDNVPLYVPFGHALVYVAIYYICKEQWVRHHKERIISLLYSVMIVYSLLWLVFGNDLLGFMFTLTIMVLFRIYPDTRLFFLLMFYMVVYLELLGTWYGCWQWPSIWFNQIPLIPSANPPSGVSVIYFTFDALCMLGYRLLHQGSWQRLQRFRHR